jgi:hypothetical protein
MKTLLLTLGLIVGLSSGVRAQNFSASQNFNQKKQGTVAPAEKAPEKLKPFAPRPSGVIYEMSEKGLVMIYPGAPASLGYGEKFLTANPFTGSQATDNANERRRDFGGLQLIGFEY